MADRQLLLIKKEVTYGVDPTAAAADTIWAENVKFTPKSDFKAPNVARPSVGPVAGHTTGVHGELTFDMPITTSGAAGTAPKWGKLALACGWAETIVPTTSVGYTLANNPSASDSVTVAWQEGLRVHKLTGARGMFSLKLTENDRPMLSLTIRGLKTLAAAGSALVPANANFTGWGDALPIVQGRTTFSFGGYALPFRDLSLSQTDNVLFSDRPNQRSVDLVGARTWTGKLKAGTPPIGSLNFEALSAAETVSTFSLVHGATAGTILTVNGRAQSRDPAYSDDKGLDVVDVDLNLVPSTLSADDELAIVLT